MTQPRIPAAKNFLGDEAIYYGLALPALLSTFYRVWLQVHGPLPDRRRGPVIFYLNHSGWWDGYMMMLVHRAVLRRRFEGYLMMEEKQLRSYRFFTWCGAFSIDRRDPADTANAIDYISNLLRQRANRALYIFPQGRIVHSDRRPIVTYPGVARIAARVGDVTLCPIIFRYEFRGEQRPEAFIRFGPLERLSAPSDSDAILARITARLTEGCDALRDAVVNGDVRDFRALLCGRPGIDKLFDGLLRLLPRRS